MMFLDIVITVLAAVIIYGVFGVKTLVEKIAILQMNLIDGIYLRLNECNEHLSNIEDVDKRLGAMEISLERIQNCLETIERQNRA